MKENNKENLLYFEASSVKELYDIMTLWQKQKQKRLLNVNIQKDADKFCCIALSNPTEVVITDQRGDHHVRVSGYGQLCVEK